MTLAVNRRRLPDLSKAADQDLVEWARMGDQIACREIVRRYGASVYERIHRIVGQDDLAEDLTQDTFVKAFAALRRCGPERNPSAWLLQIANNTALDYVRADRPDATHSWLTVTPGQLDDSGLHVSWPSDSPDPSIDLSDFAATLDRALQRLRPAHRRCFVLHCIEARSYDEIAEILNVPSSTVGTHLHRARRRLKRILGPAIGWSSSGA